MWFEKWLPFVDIRVWQQELLLIETSIGCQWWWGRIRALFYHSPPAVVDRRPIFPTTIVIYTFTQLTKDGHYFQTMFVSAESFWHRYVLFQNSGMPHCSLFAFILRWRRKNLTTPPLFLSNFLTKKTSRFQKPLLTLDGGKQPSLRLGLWRHSPFWVIYSSRGCRLLQEDNDNWSWINGQLEKREEKACMLLNSINTNF